MRRFTTTTKILIAGACLAAVVVAAVVLLGGDGAPDSLAAATAPEGGAPTPSWTFTRTNADANPIALTTDARGRAYALLDDADLKRGGWELRREGADGLLHQVAREGSGFPIHKIEAGNVAIDAHGTPIVVWETHDGAMYADIGGHESRIAARHAAKLGRVEDADPALVATADGGATVAWTTYTSGRTQAWIAERRPGQNHFGTPRLLGATIDLPTVLADHRGGVTVLYTDAGLVKTIARPRGGAFGRPTVIGKDHADRVTATIGPGGRIVATWTDNDHGVRAAQRPAGHAAFDKPVTLFGASGVSSFPKVAVDRRGLATIVFNHQDTNGVASDRADAAVVQWPADGRPGTPRRAFNAGAGHEYYPSVYATPAGPVVVVASASYGTDNAHPLIAVTPTGRRVTLAGAQHFPIVASGPSGLIAVWRFDSLGLGRLHG